MAARAIHSRTKPRVTTSTRATERSRVVTHRRGSRGVLWRAGGLLLSPPSVVFVALAVLTTLSGPPYASFPSTPPLLPPVPSFLPLVPPYHACWTLGRCPVRSILPAPLFTPPTSHRAPSLQEASFHCASRCFPLCRPASLWTVQNPREAVVTQPGYHEQLVVAICTSWLARCHASLGSLHTLRVHSTTPAALSEGWTQLRQLVLPRA